MKSLLLLLCVGVSVAFVSCATRMNDGGLAPKSVEGKTIVFSYDKAEIRQTEAGPDEDEPDRKWEKCKPEAEVALTFGKGSVGYGKTQYNEKTISTYKATSATTADVRYYVPDSDVMDDQIKLVFLTPTSGVATSSSMMCMAMYEVRGITFILK